MLVTRLANGTINAALRVRNLLGRVVRQTCCYDPTIGRIACCKQRPLCKALTTAVHHAEGEFPAQLGIVVVFQRQQLVGPVENLNLRVFVRAADLSPGGPLSLM